MSFATSAIADLTSSPTSCFANMRLPFTRSMSRRKPSRSKEMKPSGIRRLLQERLVRLLQLDLAVGRAEIEVVLLPKAKDLVRVAAVVDDQVLPGQIHARADPVEHGRVGLVLDIAQGEVLRSAAAEEALDPDWLLVRVQDGIPGDV